MDEHRTTSEPHDGDPEYDTKAAAAYLGCSPGYLCNARSWGDGPDFHRKFKRKGIFYVKSDLDAFRLRQRYSSTTEY